MTPLASTDGTVRAIAQGSISIGGFNVQADDGNRIFNNYMLVGRVPNGARITNPIQNTSSANNEIVLSLHNADFTTADRISERINLKYGFTSYAVNGGTVRILVPDSMANEQNKIKFISDVGQLQIVPDHIARVVVNEKTGTIVVGQNVVIEPVAVAHGTITVDIQSTPVISQPAPFSEGETVVTAQSQINIHDEPAHVLNIEEAVQLSDIAKALNSIGATPRDIIAIFQALKQAGALRAELIVL